MQAEYARFPGVVQDGKIVVPAGLQLPNGTVVDVVVHPVELTPEEQAEFAAWDRLGDEAWGMIDWGEGGIARDSG